MADALWITMKKDEKTINMELYQDKTINMELHQDKTINMELSGDC